MKNDQIYNFVDPREYLAYLLEQKQTLNKRYSLRAFARDLGLENHGLLSLVLSKKRTLSVKFLNQVINRLQLENSEERYLKILVRFHNAENDDDKALFSELIHEMRPDHTFDKISIEQSRALTDWRYLAVIGLVLLKDFNESPEWIANAIGRNIDSKTAAKILNELINVKLLFRNDNGELEFSSEDVLGPDEIPSGRIKKVQKEFLGLAQDAIDEQDIEQREFFQYTIGLNHEDVVEAKKILKDFRIKFVTKFKNDKADHLYQFGFQLFQLNKNNNFKHIIGEQHENIQVH